MGGGFGAPPPATDWNIAAPDPAATEGTPAAAPRDCQLQCGGVTSVIRCETLSGLPLERSVTLR